MNVQQEQQSIWSGTLEWHETRGGLKIPCVAPCRVTADLVNGEPEVKGDGWPIKLIMQLIPKSIVGSLGDNFMVRDVKKVFFSPQISDVTNSLMQRMDSGYVGCVHFTGPGMQQNECYIKVLILKHSKEEQTFTGFIPNDQAGFVNRIRAVIRQITERQRQGGMPIPEELLQSPMQQSQQIVQLPSNDEFSILDLLE